MKKHSPEIKTAIVAGVTKGAGLASLCRAQGIARTTLAGWLRTDPAFARRLAWARDAFCDALVEECLAIADDSSNDWVERPGGKGGQVPDLENMRRAQGAIDARMRVVARWDRVDFQQTASRTADAEAAAFNAAVIGAMCAGAAKLAGEGDATAGATRSAMRP